MSATALTASAETPANLAPDLPVTEAAKHPVNKVFVNNQGETAMKKMMIMAAAGLMAAMAFAAQCAAKTEDGAQCRRQAEENSKYCWQHLKAATQCQALTQEGTRCKRKAEAGKKYCWQHANYKPGAKKTEAEKVPTKKIEAKKSDAKKTEATPKKAPAKKDAPKAEGK